MWMIFVLKLWLYSGDREHRGYNNNRYNQQQQQDYSASSSNDYYSQYQGYYAQYGYDQYAGGQDAQGKQLETC